jgi:acetyltransferase-like isoleucine patch superfamily enzyme
MLPKARSAASVRERLREQVTTGAHHLGPRRIAWGLFNALPPFTMRVARTQLLRWIGGHVSERAGVIGTLTLLGPPDCATHLRVGSGTLISHDVVLGLEGTITLGENVIVGPYAILHTATHSLGPSSRRMNPVAGARPIVVEDGAWIGMRAMILPGVRLGRGCVVAPGAVVRKDVPPDTLVAGNPATIVRELPADGSPS